MKYIYLKDNSVEIMSNNRMPMCVRFYYIMRLRRRKENTISKLKLEDLGFLSSDLEENKDQIK